MNCLSLLSAYRLSVPFVVSSGVPLCGAGRFCFPSRFVSGRLACRRSCSSFRRVGSFWRRAVFVSSFSRVVVLISFVPFVVSSARVVLRFVRSRRLACRPVVRFGFLRLVGRLVMRLVRRLVFSSYSLRRPSSFIGRGCPRDWRLVLRRLVRRLSFSFAPRRIVMGSFRSSARPVLPWGVIAFPIHTRRFRQLDFPVFSHCDRRGGGAIFHMGHEGMGGRRHADDGKDETPRVVA